MPFRLPLILALAALPPFAAAQASVSQHVSAAAAGVNLRANRTVSVRAVNHDPQNKESRDRLEKVRAAGLGALKGTPLHAVHGNEMGQATLEISVVRAGEAHSGDFVSVVLRDNGNGEANGKVLYCASEQGMAQRSAVRELLTQFNSVVSGTLPAPTPDALDTCAAQAQTAP